MNRDKKKKLSELKKKKKKVEVGLNTKLQELHKEFGVDYFFLERDEENDNYILSSVVNIKTL